MVQDALQSAWFLRSAAALLLGGLAAIGQAQKPITFATLLEEIVDREALARFPDPYFTCKQFSSYDRRSTDPAKQKTWFANWDRSQFVRTEQNGGRTEHVMMDASGPGAIVRVWVTWRAAKSLSEFSDGTLRLYLDHSEDPTFEGPVSKFVDGNPWAGAPLSQGVSDETEYNKRGHNLYLPIPYAKHCKITYETDAPLLGGAREGEALYYQINYRSYSEGTPVETFSAARLDEVSSLLEQVQSQLDAGAEAVEQSGAMHDWSGKLSPGESQLVFESESGPSSIRRLSIKLAAEDLPQALRSTVLKATFDGEETTWAPIGDFSGTGYKICPHTTWFTHTEADGAMHCLWVMPFESSAKITLENLGKQTVEVQSSEIEFAPWKWDARSMHFHARWRLLPDLRTKTNEEADWSKAFDVDFTTIEGAGVYVGDTLTLHNGAARWWGEGDEKIYVDGERFPSHFGTGTEDYYGYAWCRPENFCAPFHAQPDGGGNLEGGFSVNSRYRALDRIPFRQSLNFDMEVWHWLPTTIDYAPTTFFYGKPGVSADPRAAPDQAILPVKLTP